MEKVLERSLNKARIDYITDLAKVWDSKNLADYILGLSRYVKELEDECDRLNAQSEVII